MSCRRTDGPVLKLQLIVSSLSCCLNSLSLSISTNLSSLLVFHTHCHLSSRSLAPSPPQRQSVWLVLALSRSPSHSLPLLSFIFGPIRPSFLFSVEIFPSSDCFFLRLFFFFFNSHTLPLCFSFRQLMENKITTIERGAFQDLKELERL